MDTVKILNIDGIDYEISGVGDASEVSYENTNVKEVLDTILQKGTKMRALNFNKTKAKVTAIPAQSSAKFKVLEEHGEGVVFVTFVATTSDESCYCKVNEITLATGFAYSAGSSTHEVTLNFPVRPGDEIEVKTKTAVTNGIVFVPYID